MTIPEMDKATDSQALTTSPQLRPAPPALQLKQGLEQMRPQLAMSLPSHIKPERFERVVMTAVNNNPALLKADRRSFFNACTKAANDGLVPDGREGAFVIFSGQVQWMPMVYGLIKLIRQTGEIDSVGARIVYAKELELRDPKDPLSARFRFVVENGQEKLFHDPILFGERGEKVLVYGYARFKETGHVEYAPLHKLDVLKRKAASRSSSSGPWKDWEDEMWLKTAIKALAKRLPLSADVQERIEHSEPTVFDQLKSDAIAQLGALPAGQIEDDTHTRDDHADHAGTPHDDNEADHG